MTTKAIMSTDLVTVHCESTVADALLLMCENQVHNVPVVDDQGLFKGLLSLRQLTRALLPKAARLDQHSLLMHVDFMPDDPGEFSERLAKIGNESVCSLLAKEKRLRVCTPDTPIPELLQMLYESPTSLPVVVLDGKKERLVGMVSNWDVLNKLVVNLLSSTRRA